MKRTIVFFSVLTSLILGFQAQADEVCDVVSISGRVSKELTDLLSAKGYKVFRNEAGLSDFLTLSFEDLPPPANLPANRFQITHKVRLTANPNNYLARLADGYGSVSFKLSRGFLRDILMGVPSRPEEDPEFAEKVAKARAKAEALALAEFDRQLPVCR